MGVEGVDRLRVVADRLPKAVDKELVAAMRGALEARVAPFTRDVDASIADTMPKRGGYAEELEAAFRVKANITSGGGGASLRLKGTAVGRHGRKRDVASVNRGRLRHPAWGRAARSWYDTSVPPGFWTKPGRKLVQDVVKELDKTVSQAARRIEADL